VERLDMPSGRAEHRCSAVKVLGEETLKAIARDLVETVRWTPNAT